MIDPSTIAVRDTRICMYRIIKPEDSIKGAVRAGTMLRWMDVRACLSAERLSRSSKVTLSMDDLMFNAEFCEGECIKVMAQVTRAFNT
jgi:acyl-CoA hydrolase